MAAKKHIHKYHKITLGYGRVWSCAIPECSHFMPRNMEARVIGKASLCWSCGNQFVLDENNMKQDRPVCVNCDKSVERVSDALAHFGIK